MTPMAMPRSAPILEFSAGGLVVDEQGRVIATVFAKRAGVPDQAYALPNERVLAALATAGPPLRTACVER